MATLLEFPLLNGSQTVANSRYENIRSSRFAFWRAQDIQHVTDLLIQEFPGADVRNAIHFARVVVNPADGKEALAKYVRGTLYRDSVDLAA